MWLMVAQRIVLDFFLHILYFPLWWYSRGALHVGKGCVRLIETTNYTLAPGLWLRNIFVPIFGADDWQGRIISFFLRLVNICIRSALLLILIGFVFFLFFLWLIAPVFFIIMLIRAF